MEHDEEIIDTETLNVDATLDSISRGLEAGKTLILDVGSSYYDQTDIIYDKLVMRGYEVKKLFRNGKNQIIVSRKL